MSTGASPMMAKWLPEALVSVLGAIWFVIVVRMALRKHYKKLRIALLPRS
jgi:hypothetical protein